MRVGILVALLVVSTTDPVAQSVYLTAGPGQYAMGNIVAGRHYTLQRQHKLFPHRTSWESGVTGHHYFATNNIFSLGVLTRVVPAESRSALGLSMQYTGLDRYSEALLSLFGSVQEISSFDLAIEAGVLRYGLSNRTPRWLLFYKIVTKYRIRSQVSIALLMQNPIPLTSTRDTPDRSGVALAIEWLVNPQLTAITELRMFRNRPTEISFGMEYITGSVLTLRIGTSTSPARYYFGTAFDLFPGLTCEISMQYHSALGISPLAAITYSY